jgi:hypothetical protein
VTEVLDDRSSIFARGNEGIFYLPYRVQTSFKPIQPPCIEGAEERKWREAGEDSMRSCITCRLPQILYKVIKSRRIRRAEHVTQMGEMRNA